MLFSCVKIGVCSEYKKSILKYHVYSKEFIFLETAILIQSFQFIKFLFFF